MDELSRDGLRELLLDVAPDDATREAMFAHTFSDATDGVGAELLPPDSWYDADPEGLEDPLDDLAADLDPADAPVLDPDADPDVEAGYEPDADHGYEPGADHLFAGHDGTDGTAHDGGFDGDTVDHPVDGVDPGHGDLTGSW